MDPCIFCSIAQKTSECSLVFEDERFIAFLPLTPVNPGHTLLMPKTHFEDIFRTPPVEVLGMLKVAAKIASAIEMTVQPIRVGVVAMGLDVQHTHFHLVPLYSRLDITSKAEVEGRLVKHSRDELDKMAASLRAAINSSTIESKD